MEGTSWRLPCGCGDRLGLQYGGHHVPAALVVAVMRDLLAEEVRRVLGDAWCGVAAGPESRGGADEAQTARFTLIDAVPYPPQKHGDLGTLRAVVAVHLIEHHEAPMLSGRAVEETSCQPGATGGTRASRSW